MFHVILTIHIILCICLVFLVLIQQGKGADMGAAFGGGSNTVFGASGAPDFLTKLTTGMAVAFMVTSILLVRSYSKVGVTSAPADPLAGSVLEGAKKPEPAPAADARPAEDAAPKAADAAPEQAAPAVEQGSPEAASSEQSAPAGEVASVEQPAAPAESAPAESAAAVESNDASQTNSQADVAKPETAAQSAEQAAPAN